MDERTKQTIEDARKSGDTDTLYVMLRAEADRQGEEIEVARLAYAQVCREIAVIAGLRGDVGHG